MVMKVTLNSKAIKNYRSEFDICSTTHKLYEMDKFFYLPSRLVFFSFFFFFFCPVGMNLLEESGQSGYKLQVGRKGQEAWAALPA